MNVVIFGAGNVGKGFLGLEMYLRGYGVTFIDVDKQVIDYLKVNGGYEVRFFDGGSSQSVKVQEALHISQSDSIQEALHSADIILTAVGAGNLGHVSSTIAKGVKNSRKQLVIACENVPKNTERLKQYISEIMIEPTNYAEFANCVIDRICLRKGDSVIVEPTYEWIVETRSDILRDVEKTDDLEPYFTRRKESLGF